MSNADIRLAVDDSFQAYQRACQGFVRTDPSDYPLLPDPCSPIVILTLLIGLACSLLGYLTFLVLAHKEDSAVAKAMQHEARSEAQTNGLHEEDPAGPTKLHAAVGEQKQLQPNNLQPVEYEAAEPSEQSTPPQQTAAPPTPVPGTPTVTSQAPAKGTSDSEDSRQPSKLAALKSVLSAVRLQTVNCES